MQQPALADTELLLQVLLEQTAAAAALHEQGRAVVMPVWALVLLAGFAGLLLLSVMAGGVFLWRRKLPSRRPHMLPVAAAASTLANAAAAGPDKSPGNPSPLGSAETLDRSPAVGSGRVSQSQVSLMSLSPAG